MVKFFIGDVECSIDVLVVPLGCYLLVGGVCYGCGEVSLLWVPCGGLR